MTNDDFNIISTVRNVNGDMLANKIKLHIEECLDVMLRLTFGVEEEREDVADNIEYFLMELYLNNEITQGKVVFDKRNNSRANTEKGKFTLEVTYKEWNCLNFTTIKYNISKKLSDDDIDFVTY